MKKLLILLLTSILTAQTPPDFPSIPSWEYGGLFPTPSTVDSTSESLDSDEDGVYTRIDNCPDTFNPYQEDEDNDGLGDVCDNCNNEIFYKGNINGEGVVDIVDVLMLIDVILGIETNTCSYESSDINLLITDGVTFTLNSKLGIFCNFGGSLIIDGSLNI